MTNDNENAALIKEARIGSRTNPLRLATSPEEYEAQLADEDRPDLGVTGSRYAGEEATVTLTVNGVWYEMDVEYAKLITVMLIESIKGAQEHNAALREEGKL